MLTSVLLLVLIYSQRVKKKNLQYTDDCVQQMQLKSSTTTDENDSKHVIKI